MLVVHHIYVKSSKDASKILKLSDPTVMLTLVKGNVNINVIDEEVVVKPEAN
jgi:hypothetical protein